MGGVGKREETWNELIRRINELAASPEEGCDPITPPLEEVGLNHRWKKSDIRAAQDRLREICGDNSFATVPDKWKQATIDELNAAIEAGWCGCDDDDGGGDGDECDEEQLAVALAEDGTEFLLYSNAPTRVSANCYGDVAEDGIDIDDLINGMQVATPGYNGRIWEVQEKNHRNGGGIFVARTIVGVIDCDGTVICTTKTMRISYHNAVFVFCGECIDVTCETALANAETVANSPDAFFSSWTLRVLANNAYCCD